LKPLLQAPPGSFSLARFAAERFSFSKKPFFSPPHMPRHGHNAPLSRASNPTMRQGAMDTHADFDNTTMKNVRGEISRGRLSYYPHATDGSAGGLWNVVEREVAYTTLGRRPTDDPAVLTTLNGQGVNAAAAFAGRENARELTEMAVRNNIQPFGVAVESLPVNPSGWGPQKTGVAVALAGLNTLQQSATAPRNIRAGELVEALVPPAVDLAGNGGGSNNSGQDGVPPEKFRLECGPVDPTLPGRRLRLVVRELITDPNSWAAAMGGHLRGTHVWLSAGRTVAESYMLSALLTVGVLIREGHLQPSGGLAALLAGQGAAGGNVQDTAENVVVALSQALALRAVPSGGLRATLTPPQRAAFGKLKHTIASTIFYDGVAGKVNKRFEFAYRAGGDGAVASSKALAWPANTPKKHDPYGEVLQAQLNHFPQAVSAFHDAIMDQQRFILGKATSSVSGHGSRAFNIALGVCKP